MIESTSSFGFFSIMQKIVEKKVRFNENDFWNFDFFVLFFVPLPIRLNVDREGN